MNKCIDCKVELKGHEKPVRCKKCNSKHRSLNFKHSESTKIKISISKTKQKKDKFCTRCDNKISSRNKKGLCHPCSKSGHWYSGLKINELEFVKFIDKNKNGNEIWEIKCFCGNKFKTNASKVKLGRTKSCGCLNKEHCKRLGMLQKGKNSPVWIRDRTKTKTSVFIRKKDVNRNSKGSWQYFSRKYKKEKKYTCELTKEKLTEPYQLAVHHIEAVVLSQI